MKARLIFTLFIALFTLACAGTGNAGIIRKENVTRLKTIVIPQFGHRHVYQQGKHRWHHMRRRRVTERVHRHRMRRIHHREVRHEKR